MKVVIRKKSGGNNTLVANHPKGYNVVAKPHVSDKDWVQFWTWIKYEVNINYNDKKKTIGCKEYTLRQIKKAWGDKFFFDSPF